MWLFWFTGLTIGIINNIQIYASLHPILLRKSEDTKWIFKNGKSKRARKYNGQTKETQAKRHTMVHKTLNRKLKIEQHELN
jgi:hypothetical protein